MSLAGRCEVRIDPYVELLATPRQREPYAATGLQRIGLLDLRQAEQLPVEAARLRLATGRRGELDVVDAEGRDA